MGEARNLGARIQVRRETKRKAALGALFLGRGMQKLMCQAMGLSRGLGQPGFTRKAQEQEVEFRKVEGPRNHSLENRIVL